MVMVRRRWSAIARIGAALLLVASNTAAEDTSTSPVSSSCSPSSVCASINIPSSNSSEDVFLQVRGPESAGWVGIGIGSQMAGALMFVIYPDGNGNVTLSVREGEGHFEPEEKKGVDVEVLDAGIEDGKMSVDFRCSNCRTWSDGSLDVTSKQHPFLWALGPGTDIASTDTNYAITQHADKGFFGLNLVAATGGNGTANPFANTDPESNGGSSIAAPKTSVNNYLIAHGVIMSLAFIILMPLGAAVVRLLNSTIPQPVLVHRVLQIFNFLLVIVGMAMALTYVHKAGHKHFRDFHQIFGMILICLLVVQAILGSLHHSHYQKFRQRSYWSHAHIWLGRSVILLGIVNGGLGLRPGMADASDGQMAPYAIVAVLVVGTYGVLYWMQSRPKMLPR